MNAKERMRMQRLEVENAKLRERLKKHLEVYGNMLFELVDAKTRLEMFDFAMQESEIAKRSVS